MQELKRKLIGSFKSIDKRSGFGVAEVYTVLLLMLLVAQIVSPGYLKGTHVAGILRLASFIGIAAIGQNLTILTGGIDLSIANTITFANVIAAQIMMGRNENLLIALLNVIIMGIVIGLINGAGIYWLKIPPFIMTLGVGTIIQGIFLIYTKGAPKGNTAPLLRSICDKNLFGIVSGIVILWILSAVIVSVVLKYSPYGRKLYSIGTNEQAARFSGILTGRVTFSVYLISAIISAVSGFLLVGYTGTSFLDVGTSYNTKTIAAVIIGGTAITGGKGGYIGTIAGAIIMTILEDFLTIINIPDAGRQIMQGVIILILVFFYSREKLKR
ncbi:MAG: ABC transporter permease [Stomatobaculum sp.]